MDTIKNTVNQASEKIQEAGYGTSKEANKHVAKDGNNSLGTRATAAKDALSDKYHEEKHHAHAEAEKQKPT